MRTARLVGVFLCMGAVAILASGYAGAHHAAALLPPPTAQNSAPHVEDLPFADRPDTLRSGVFFNDRFASNRWEPGDADPPPVASSHYAFFSERYIQGDHESTKAFGMWQYATIYTNSVAQGDYAAGKNAFLFHLRHALASPGVWMAEDSARKSRNTVIQVSLMPWYLSESSNTTIVEPPIMHAHRRMYTSQEHYRDLVYTFAYEIITSADWSGRVRYWEGPINEPQRYWRGSLAQLSQLYADFAQSVQRAEADAQAAGLSTGTFKIGGSSPAAWWMAITVTDSPPGASDGPDPGPSSPLVEINKRLIDDHLVDPETPLDFISWHHVRGSAALNADNPYPGLPESNFGGVEPGWCSTAMQTTRSWITDAGGNPDEVEYVLTEWFNLGEAVGDPAGIYSAVIELNARANIARSDLGGDGFDIVTRSVWEDWSNIPSGDQSGPGLYHKVGRYPKPMMTLHTALHRLGSMAEVRVEHLNYPDPNWGAAITGRDGARFMKVEGRARAWTFEIASEQFVRVLSVVRLDGATPFPGIPDPLPAPASSISIAADAWEVLIVEFEVIDPCELNGDINNDGRVGIEDLYESYGTPSDINGDGVADAADRRCLEAFLRRNELSDMTSGRR